MKQDGGAISLNVDCILLSVHVKNLNLIDLWFTHLKCDLLDLFSIDKLIATWNQLL